MHPSSLWGKVLDNKKRSCYNRACSYKLVREEKMKRFLKEVRNCLLALTVLPEITYMYYFKKQGDEHVSEYLKWVMEVLSGD